MIDRSVIEAVALLIKWVEEGNLRQDLADEIIKMLNDRAESIINVTVQIGSEEVIVFWTWRVDGKQGTVHYPRGKK